jgi:hypothetical protein
MHNHVVSVYLLLVFQVNWSIEVWNIFLGNFNNQIVLASVCHSTEGNNTLWWAIILKKLYKN